MIDAKDALDLLTIVNNASFKGTESERVAEIKAKLAEIVKEGQQKS